MNYGYFFFLSSLWIACGKPENCDESGIPSVVIAVTDSTGAEYYKARVTYSDTHHGEQSASCGDLEGTVDLSGASGCHQWIILSDPGTVLIKATNEEGTKLVQKSVEATENGCDVITQKVTMALP